MTKKERILISGANGLLGSSLLLRLHQTGHDVFSLDADIRDDKIIAKFAKMQFDWIVHTAALTDVDLCEKDTKLCYDTNVLGTRNVISLANSMRARVIYISTASVFSGMSGDYKEGDTPYPTNFYNLSKVLGEEIARGYERALILRLNLIGIHPGGSRGRNFFEWLVNRIKNNQDIQLFNDVIINPLSNLTIAEVVDKLISIKPEDKVLHVGSSNTLSKADIGRLVVGAFKDYKGTARYVSVDGVSVGAARPKQMWLNTDYIQKRYSVAMPTLESEVRRILHEKN